jgi:co-chaperonin GroES (HSP10)
MAQLTPIRVDSFKALRDHVWVSDLDHGQKITKSGLIIPDDDMTNRGIRPRWGRVVYVGPEINSADVEIGDWVMTEHGRWTNKITLTFADDSEIDMWRLDYPNAVLVRTKDDPRTVTGDLSNRNLEFALRGSGW